MKAQDLRTKDAAELGKMLLDLRREQFNLFMQRGSGQIARPSQLRTVRRDIARVKTVLNEKKAGGV